MDRPPDFGWHCAGIHTDVGTFETQPGGAAINREPGVTRHQRAVITLSGRAWAAAGPGPAWLPPPPIK
jgi:hypothetical protein